MKIRIVDLCGGGFSRELLDIKTRCEEIVEDLSIHPNYIDRSKDEYCIQCVIYSLILSHEKDFKEKEE